MRRWGLLLLTLVAASGCVELNAWLKDKPTPESAPVLVSPSRPRKLVTPEEVSDRNAREVLDALREELDRSESDARPRREGPVSGKK